MDVTLNNIIENVKQEKEKAKQGFILITEQIFINGEYDPLGNLRNEKGIVEESYRFYTVYLDNIEKTIKSIAENKGK